MSSEANEVVASVFLECMANDVRYRDDIAREIRKHIGEDEVSAYTLTIMISRVATRERGDRPNLHRAFYSVNDGGLVRYVSVDRCRELVKKADAEGLTKKERDAFLAMLADLKNAEGDAVTKALRAIRRRDDIKAMVVDMEVARLDLRDA